MMTVNIDLDSKIVKKTLRDVREAISGSKAVELVKGGAEEARNAATEYHIGFNEAGGWKGNRYLGPGQRAGEFGSRVARGWTLGEVTKDSASIINNAEHFAFKVTGGTITPKRAKALTIPLIAEARGLYARDYVRITGRKLFPSKSKKALLERDEGSVKGVRAVYALMKSVTQRPWPNALPPEDKISNAFVRRYIIGLEKIIESS